MSHEDFLENCLRTALVRVFGDLDAAAFGQVRTLFEWVEISGGHRLFGQGDEGDSMFVLAAGRMRVSRMRPSGIPEHLDDIVPGETVGEMALITGEPRTADITALRDSVLARLSKANFERLAEQYPRALLHISRNIIERLQNRGKAKPSAKPIRNICLLPITDGPDRQRTARQVCDCLAPHGSALLLDSATVNRSLQQRNIAETARSERSAYHGLTAWLEMQEAQHRFVVYLPDADDTEWTRRPRRSPIFLKKNTCAARGASRRPASAWCCCTRPALQPLATRAVGSPSVT
jgi:NTE family protein